MWKNELLDSTIIIVHFRAPRIFLPNAYCVQNVIFLCYQVTDRGESLNKINLGSYQNDLLIFSIALQLVNALPTLRRQKLLL